MASNFVKIMEARKMALKKGENEKAQALMNKARELAREGKVSEKEFQASLYL